MKYLSLAILFLLANSCSQLPTKNKEKQNITVIAHRGASGYMPEHTLEAYNLAIEMGADFIEPDLVMTKDHVLIARHENEISGTTDVATKFPNLKKTKVIDKEKITGWFTEDLTLKQIKTLKAKERLLTRSQLNNGKFEVATFDEILNLVEKRSRELNKKIGIYPETKHPSYFKSIGLPLEDELAKALKKANLAEASSPVFIQSFELESLKKLKILVNCKLIYLLEDDSNSTTLDELKKISVIAYGVGPSKKLILSHPNFIVDAHEAGLKVHPYTFRSDKPFLSDEYAQNPKAEYFRFFELGIDGVFSDFADHAIQARKEWLNQ